MMQAEFPTPDMTLTQLQVVSDLEKARNFYRDMLGATIFREYGGSSCVLNFQGSWLLLVTGGSPTRDKPTIVFEPPTNPDSVSHELTIRVPDCQAAYEVLKARGAIFLTPPVNWDPKFTAF